ncbi:tRNA (adenine(58)-N(1))-methyltransferase non-catalytic subunit trm6 isoform X2 [Rhodamnia argentea]|uniref:tRNA (adenine(58)-N(1))-methyltransferase non-catalytic subunit TRM6 n=1 Tax=Rhodamnia argentea TaxID=178133 RepID=A0A8B8NXV4_9MYRT|nr:tRNA (adenine(58)-N(1))-methyltransferase non-catalytic subunit trm6 isoform X2 [Rhodamnia argentea]
MSGNQSNVDSVQSRRVTWEGCSVLLDINDGDRLVFSRLTENSTLKIGKKNYSLRPLIGCPFGSLFQVEYGAEGSKLSRLLRSAEVSNIEDNGDYQPVEEHRDNRELVDNNKAQSLSGEDIEELRRQGATGDEIIEALIANSATFEKKTAFSQEKYRLKKQKKYAPRVLLRRPVARSICETYFTKYPARIGFMRVDTLSLLLSMANVAANSDILVVDMVGGLLTGAVAERMGGSGYVCNMYLESSPYPMDIVRMFNFGDEICKRIVRTSLSDLCSVQNDPSEQMGHDVSATANSSNEQMCSHETLTEPSGMEEIALPSENEVSKCKIPKAGDKASQETIDLWKANGFSSLIVAAPELDTWNTVKDLMPHLSHSAPFAIYHQYLQPLATCMHRLQSEKMAVGLQISEPWLREYQVLPSRTHPCMQMSAFGGYILSGVKICNPESA